MRMASTFIATATLALVVLLAALAAVTASSGAFGFDSWPTARELSVPEQAVAVDGPVTVPVKAHADARPRRERAAERQGAELIAAAPEPKPARPRDGAPRSAPAPVSRDSGPQADETPQAPAEESIPTVQEPEVPAAPSEPAPVRIPAPELELPAKDLTEPLAETPDGDDEAPEQAPDEAPDEGAEVWGDSEKARKPSRRHRHHGRD